VRLDFTAPEVERDNGFIFEVVPAEWSADVHQYLYATAVWKQKARRTERMCYLVTVSVVVVVVWWWCGGGGTLGER
jgi:hypothetical protein